MIRYSWQRVGRDVLLRVSDEDSIVLLTQQEAEELAEFIALEGEDSIKKAKELRKEGKIDGMYLQHLSGQTM